MPRSCGLKQSDHDASAAFARCMRIRLDEHVTTVDKEATWKQLSIAHHAARTLRSTPTPEPRKQQTGTAEPDLF